MGRARYLIRAPPEVPPSAIEALKIDLSGPGPQPTISVGSRTFHVAVLGPDACSSFITFTGKRAENGEAAYSLQDPLAGLIDVYEVIGNEDADDVTVPKGLPRVAQVEGLKPKSPWPAAPVSSAKQKRKSASTSSKTPARKTRIT
eukprot:tig00020554_g10810.t1